MFLVGAIAASVALVIGVGALVWNWPTPLDARAWATAALQLEWPESADLKTIASAPESHPNFDRWQQGVRVDGWLPVKIKHDRDAIAYRVTQTRKGFQATLFVFRPRSVDPNLPLAPPMRPLQLTSQSSVGVWSANGLVYVLVVNGDSRQYQGFIHANELVSRPRQLDKHASTTHPAPASTSGGSYSDTVRPI